VRKGKQKKVFFPGGDAKLVEIFIGEVRVDLSGKKANQKLKSSGSLYSPYGEERQRERHRERPARTVREEYSPRGI